jgi:RNA polymerase sigma-70 factor, ECF subfamily
MIERAAVLSPDVMAAAGAVEREFEALLTDSAVLAFRVAYGVLRHKEDSEDVAQEAFARAYRRFAQLRDRTKFRAWLIRMTWRLAIDRYRENRRRGSREVAVDVDGPAADVDPASAERAARLWRAIDELPDKLRVTLVLASIQGHNMREVAALLDVPEGTVKSRLFLARQQLRERLS